MVEVDVFWSYAFGSGFALASFRQLRKLQAASGDTDSRFEVKDMIDIRKIVKEIESGNSPAFQNEYFLKNLLFLSLLFVPSGSNLLWSNPNWETMQVGSYETIPGWLVSGFTITNVTQGILGYWVTYNYLMQGKYFKAAQQTALSWLAFWFILVNGWDKTGYKRFFSKNREAFDDWKWTNVFGWVGSDVVRILLSYGVFLIPILLYWMTKWIEDGYTEEMEMFEVPIEADDRMKRMAESGGLFLFFAFGLLGAAAVAHLLIRWLGWIKGSLAFAGLFWGGVLSKKGIGPALMKRLLRVDTIEGPPVWELAAVEEAQEELVGIEV